MAGTRDFLGGPVAAPEPGEFPVITRDGRRQRLGLPSVGIGTGGRDCRDGAGAGLVEFLVGAGESCPRRGGGGLRPLHPANRSLAWLSSSLTPPP